MLAQSTLTESEKAETLVRLTNDWRDRLKADFEFFTEEVLGFDNAPHQKEWCSVLGNQAYRRIVAAAPRGHSKTTEFSINYPLWEIARNSNVRILLVSAADTQSQSFLREIKGRIERDDTYIEFAGQHYDKTTQKWTDKEIIIKRDRTDLKDPTISTVSVEGTILSKRADIIICDDILNFENTRTPEQRQKIRDWFYTVLLPVLEPKTGRLIVAGTIWQVDDLMENLLIDPMFDYRKRYQAIIKEPDRPELWQAWCNILMEETDDHKFRAEAFREEHRALMDEGIQVLWPARMGYEELYMLRHSDSYSFARAYMNDPASRPSQTIKREWIERALERGKKIKLSDFPVTEYISITTEGIDLAISQESAADDTAKVTLDKLRLAWGGLAQGHFVIRQIKRGKMTGGQTKEMIIADFYAMRPHGLRVESVAYQEYLQRELNDGGIPIKGHRTGSEKWDSSVGVNTIGTLLENDMLTIPSDPHDARTKELSEKLKAEMLAFPEGHTGDSLMALWFAYLEMVDITGNRIIMPTSTDTSLTTIVKQPAPAGTPERKEQEKAADVEVMTHAEIMRSRALYWQKDQKRIMGSGGPNPFMRK